MVVIWNKGGCLFICGGYICSGFFILESNLVMFGYIEDVYILWFINLFLVVFLRF